MSSEEILRDYCRRGFSLVPFRAIQPEPGKTKWGKRPLVKWEDRMRQAADVETVLAEFRQYPDALVGCCTGPVSNIVNLDVDDEEGRERLDELVPDSLLVPTYKTISGGTQMIFKAPTPCPAGAVRFLPGLDFRGTGSCTILPPSDLGYEWLPGLSIAEVDPPSVPEPLYKYISLCTYRACKENVRPGTDSLQFLTSGRRDQDLFRIANCLIKGGCKEEIARQVLEKLAKSCTPAFPEKEAQVKIDSALSRCERKERNLTEDLRRWIDLTSAYFSLTEAYDPLQILTSQKNTVHQIMHRFVKEGYVERHPNKNGIYRRIDREIEFMDFASADIENTVDLRLPLQLHAKTSFYPKSVIVGAGVSGTGKTLFAFNAIAENRGRFPIYYFNSEMGPEALKKKLSHFPIPISEWAKHMKVVDGWDFNSIADKVQPDAFNVIDYLEPDGDRPYNIHGVISAIIHRLNKGTALIMIQKKPGATLGTGGIYSIKAATLAFSLEWGRLEIVKNRFREADMQPGLNKLNFEVHQGYKFVKVGGWYK